MNLDSPYRIPCPPPPAPRPLLVDSNFFYATIILLTVALAPVASGGCAQVPVITAAVVGEINCVENQLAAGDDTFEGIAIACAPLAVEDVVTIVGALAQPASDGGNGTSPVSDAAKKVHHVAPGQQPKPAIPAS
jgi:hypothetical protein